MAGTIAVTADQRWSAATWLFDWTVEFLAKDMGDEETVTHLREIIEDNLGWLSLGDLAPGARGELLRRIRSDLMEAAEATFASKSPIHLSALEALRDLVRIVEDRY